jgi:polyisoprenoid-binding protein YceI
MPSPDPEGVQAGAYNIEPYHTRVLFDVLHMGFTHYYGDFTGVSGQLSIDPKHIADASVSVSFPTASVSTTNAKLDGELKSGDWLDATSFPTITFVSKHVTRTGPTTARIEGDLTLHGVTHPVVLEAKFNAVGPNPFNHKLSMGFDATGHLKRSDFGVAKYVPMVGDDVDIIISAAFEKAS